MCGGGGGLVTTARWEGVGVVLTWELLAKSAQLLKRGAKKVSHCYVLREEGVQNVSDPQSPLKLHFEIPFSLSDREKNPVPIYVICDYYIHKTDLADVFSFLKDIKMITANIAIFFTFTIRKFTTSCVFPVFWENVQIPVFPDREFIKFWSFFFFFFFIFFLLGIRVQHS